MQSDIGSMALQISNDARTVVIKNDEQRDKAISIGKMIKSAQDDVEQVFGTPKDASYKLYKAHMDTYNRFMKPLQDAEKALKFKIKEYIDEQDKKRLEAERKAEEEAEKERQKLLRKADKLEAKGNDWKAEEIREEAESIEPVVVSVSSYSPSGLTAKRWSFEVTDMSKFPEQYIIRTADTKALQALADQTKGQLQVPGVRFFPNTQIRF